MLGFLAWDQTTRTTGARTNTTLTSTTAFSLVASTEIE